MVATQKAQIRLTFDLRRIAFLGICVAILYGAAPMVAALAFDERLPFASEYTNDFMLVLIFAGLLSFPIVKDLHIDVELDLRRLTVLMMLATLAFATMQVSVYSSFEAAFVSAYTERAGIAPEGGLRFLFAPLLMVFLACLFLCSIFMRSKRGGRLNWLLLVSMTVATALVFGLGSRNSLLWGYSGLLAVLVSRLRYRSIFLVAVSLYLMAVSFAYVRNNAVLAYFLGVTDITAPLTLDYFNPIIHEFGSSYRLFEMISSDPYSHVVAHSAPYGLAESLYLNMLPLAWKPDDFVSFTGYLSRVYAQLGQGVGSSPMTEMLFSGGWSLAMVALVVALINWPPQYLHGMPWYRFVCVGASIAIYFNFWRIGTAELLKMYFSFAVTLFAVGYVVGLRIWISQNDPQRLEP
jgi:hypothetical protein